MRLSHAALLALPAAILPLLVAAVPSPSPYTSQQHDQQQLFPLPEVSPRPSRWRTLSANVIERIWQRPVSHHTPASSRTPRITKPYQTSPPPHTFARYEGDVVLRFNISTAEEAKSLAEAADTLLLDVWEFTHDWVDIRLSKDIVAPLLGLLPVSLQQRHTPLLDERHLLHAIHDTYPSPRPQERPSPTPANLFNPLPPASHPKGSGPESNIFFQSYQPLSVITPWLNLLASLFSTHTTALTLGTSALGRDIPALRVGVHPTLPPSDPTNPPSKRRTVLVTGGLHAREWISTSTVNYLAYSLITSYGKSPTVTTLLENFDFIFVPTLNPDGYDYTWTTDRLWRKNRQSTSLSFCPGIDLDRSFSAFWDGNRTTTGNPCSESYAGESPSQAHESQVLAAWARNQTEAGNVEFVGFLDFHSYSQQILYPYAYSCGAEPPGLENLEELAVGLEKAIRLSHGHSYEAMPACEGNSFSSSSEGETTREAWPRMEASGGSALDFFYHELRVRYAYQIKLRDRGMYGFLLPAEHIVPTGKEILEAVLYFGEFLSEVFYSVESRKEGEMEAEEVRTEEHEVASGAGEEGEDDDEAWVVVEDIPPEADGEEEDPQWELRRRRR